MFSLTKKALIAHCVLIFAVIVLFAQTIPQIREVIPALALTPTIAYQATPGNTCDNPVISVDPVTSPTTLSGAPVSARVSLGSTFDISFTVTARNPAGTILSETTVKPGALNATINIPLQANTEHRLTVTARVLVTCRNSGGGVVGTMYVYKFTTTATNSSPLTIVQQGGYTLVPTNTATGTPTGYDLAVTGLTGGPTQPLCRNQNVTSVTVKNLGGSTSVSFWVYLNNVQSPSQTGLPPGGSIVVQFPGIVSPSTARVQGNTMVSDANPSNDSLTSNLPTGFPLSPTCTPTGPVITNTPVTPTLTPTATRTMTSPVTVSGRVTLNSSSGVGVAGVTILHAFASYTPQPVTTTDANGYYTFTKDTVGHQETNTVVAQMAGYSFTPTSCLFMNQTFGGSFTCSFIASAGGSATPPTATYTPTRTNTPGTPTRTPTRTPTSSTTTCSPVNATITAPFTFDGAGTLCWRINNIPSFINSWNVTSLTVNGVNFTNLYASTSQLPAKAADGYWYISYNSTVAWGHFEAK